MNLPPEGAFKSQVEFQAFLDEGEGDVPFYIVDNAALLTCRTVKGAKIEDGHVQIKHKIMPGGNWITSSVYIAQLGLITPPGVKRREFCFKNYFLAYGFSLRYKAWLKEAKSA